MEETRESIVAAPLGASERSFVGRVLRFVAVGGTCYLIQLGLLHLLHLSVGLYAADMVAFLLSAQVNFVLSYSLTWGDRQAAERIMLRWIKFNMNAVLSVTVVNAAAVWVLVHFNFELWVALLFANAVTAIFTFVVNHYFVFKPAALTADELKGTPA